MSEKVLLIERREKVAIVTLNRPATLNALNTEIQDAIIEACQELRNDDSVWAVIMTGAGRGFSSGADVRSWRTGEEDVPPRQERLDAYGWVGRLSTALYKTLDKPIIAAVNGVAAGAGMSVALACDMRIGSEKSRFKVVFPERSLSPDTGMSYYLPRIVGYSRACDLIYTSRYVEAEEAFRIGLLDRLVASENLMDEALKVADQIVSLPPMAMQAARRVLQQSMELAFDTQLRNEYYHLIISRRAPHDMQEQRDSFLERRHGLSLRENKKLHLKTDHSMEETMTTCRIYKKIFEPVRIGTMEIKNRIVLPPMGTGYSEGGKIGSRIIDYYEARARGGTGLIITEGIAPGVKCQGPRQLTLGDDQDLAGLAETGKRRSSTWGQNSRATASCRL